MRYAFNKSNLETNVTNRHLALHLHCKRIRELKDKRRGLAQKYPCLRLLTGPSASSTPETSGAKKPPQRRGSEDSNMGKRRWTRTTSNLTSMNWAISLPYDAHSFNRGPCHGGDRSGGKRSEAQDTALSILPEAIPTIGACQYFLPQSSLLY